MSGHLQNTEMVLISSGLSTFFRSFANSTLNLVGSYALAGAMPTSVMLASCRPPKPLAGAMPTSVMLASSSPHRFPLHRRPCQERGGNSDKAKDHHRAEGRGEITGALVKKADQW